MAAKSMLRFRKNQDQNDISGESKKLLEQHKENIMAARGRARLCLDDPKFQDLRIGYEKALSSAMDVMMNIDESEVDPIRYVFRIKDALGKVRHLRAVIKTTENMAGLKYPEIYKEV